MTIPPIDFSTTALLAEALTTVSWWRALLFFPFFLGWAYVVSSIYDKDAPRWFFKREAWNLGHMAAGVLALIAFVAIPLDVYVTLPIAVAILVADLAVYFFLRNADDRVPEAHKWSADTFARMAESRAAKREAGKQAKVTLQIAGPRGVVEPPQEETPEYEIRVIAEQLITALIEKRGTQLDVAPVKESVYGASLLVDGVRVPVTQLPAPQAVAAMDFIKRAAGMDVEDRRRKQKGEITYSTPSGGASVTAGVTAIGTSRGMTISMLIDPVGQVAFRLEDIGLVPKQLELMRAIVKEGQGTVLLGAGPDQGRTSTLYAVLREHDAYLSNVQTLEKDPQSALEGIRTNEYGADGDEATYSSTVRSILRRDPDVVGIAELPDEATAKEIALADHERTRTYVSMKADDPMRGIQLWTQMVGKESLASDALHGVVAQKLLRRVCKNCRVPFQPTPDMLKKLGLPAETKQLFRKGGTVLIKDKEETCPVCGGSGYIGQIGAFAVHEIGPAERNLVKQGDLKALKAALREKRQISIQQAALNHVLAGETTVDEVVRVTQPKAAPEKKKPAEAPKA